MEHYSVLKKKTIVKRYARKQHVILYYKETEMFELLQIIKQFHRYDTFNAWKFVKSGTHLLNINSSLTRKNESVISAISNRSSF